MKTLNTGASKYKTSDEQWAYIPCLTGMQGEKGEKGNPGEGIPTGGTSGQVLAKNTNNDYDAHWINLPTTGGESSVTIDDTLTKSGVAADAKATGDQIKKVKETIPTALKNPKPLTFTGAVTAEYDGAGAVTVSIPEGASTLRIEKTSSDTTAELDPNKLYIFPEMSSLTYTLATPSETSIASEYHFIFQSGATATELVHPANVSVPDGFAVEKNKVYEISILEGCLAYQSWAVS
jgi:hypothetical protein